jgi:NAD(P)-dependent dehydrogenase (short-subunit alcohol dehydrogenase family)
VVTGAGRGLGRAAALALAEAGAAVVLLGRDRDRLAQVATEIRDIRDGQGHRGIDAEVLCLPTDVTSDAAVRAAGEATLSRLGGADILVNNAGAALVRPLLDLDMEEARRLFEVNVMGALRCARVFGAPMVERGRGRIINIASVAGLVGEPGVSAYAASKGALLSFTRALAAEWARHNVTVNAIAPGYFRTDLNAEALDHPDLGPRIVRQIPLRRTGRPEELGPLVVYLASDASAFMTGATLVIDGGQAAR